MEEELMRTLQHSGLNKEHLAAITKTLARFDAQGVKIGRVLTKGIPPVVDTVVATSVLDEAGLATLVSALKNTRMIDHVRIFPNGIPAVEQFAVEITLR